MVQIIKSFYLELNDFYGRLFKSATQLFTQIYTLHYFFVGVMLPLEIINLFFTKLLIYLPNLYHVNIFNTYN